MIKLLVKFNFVNYVSFVPNIVSACRAGILIYTCTYRNHNEKFVQACDYR